MQGFIIALLVCSVTMSVLALFYMAITPILKKRYSEKGRYYAWLIIIVGLIIPFRPQWNNAIVQIAVPSVTATTETPAEQTGSGTNYIFVDPADGVELPNTTGLSIDDTELPTATASVSWWQIAALVWLAGVMAFLAYHAVKHYRFLKVAKRWSESVTDEKALTLLQSLKTEMGISKKIGLYQNSDMGSPLMYGFVSPRIMLPTANMADDELRFILKHELVHYKRKDLYYKIMVLVAMAIHWFNPLVYLIARAIYTQCELSCDAEIVRDTDADTRLHYSEAIIGVVKYHSKLKTALSTNFYGGKKGMKNRISSIMDTRKKRLGFVIISVMLVATLCTGFAFAASAHTDNTDKNNPGTTLQGTDTRFTDKDGKETIIDSPQIIRGERFKIGEDGKLVPDRDTWVDNYLDRLGIPYSQSPSIFDRDDENASFDYFFTDKDDDENFNTVPAASNYTAEELAQIIADIESGKLPLSGQINADGTLTIFNNPGNAFIDRSKEGEVLTEITLSFNGEDLIFGEDKIIFGD